VLISCPALAHRHLLHNIAASGARVLAALNYVFDFS